MSCSRAFTRHVVVRRSEKKTSVSAPSPGRRDLVLDLARRDTARASVGLVVGERRARRRTPASPSIAHVDRAAARCPAAPRPTACTIRPQLGSPPCSAAFTSGELATARATALDALARARRARAPARSARAPSPSATIITASCAQQRVERLAEAQLVLALGRDAHAARRPSTSGSRCRSSRAGRRPTTRSKERFTHTPEQQVRRLGARAAASVCTKHSIVAKRGEIMPAPLHWALRRTVPDGSCTSRLARFSKRSVVWIAALEGAVAVAAELARGRRRIPFSIASTGR